MKQKYTLLISDMEINVVTEESQESVEYIVGILDRKIREITLKSKRCSRNEAALLCALDLCAEKIAVKERVDELENQLQASGEDIKALTEKLEMLQKNADRLERENARLETDNSKLRAVLDDMRDRGIAPARERAVPMTADEEPEANEAIGACAADAESARDIYGAQDELEDDSVKVIPGGSVDDDAQKKKNSRNRVGSMFDLLTFSDI